GKIPALPFNLPLLKGGVLTGVDIAQIPRREPEDERRVTAQLLSWLSDKKLAPVVGQVFDFADFREAFRTMQTRAALGKMVVRIG
ncbi:MAG TPA: zinc-binding dehydrogenase, partial [Bradyrhizobium sp.]|nr:zinc-binding dehydrogenase [Bradyrhizobium sp.]